MGRAVGFAVGRGDGTAVGRVGCGVGSVDGSGEGSGVGGVVGSGTIPNRSIWGTVELSRPDAPAFMACVRKILVKLPELTAAAS